MREPHDCGYRRQLEEQVHRKRTSRAKLGEIVARDVSDAMVLYRTDAQAGEGALLDLLDRLTGWCDPARRLIA